MGKNRCAGSDEVSMPIDPSKQEDRLQSLHSCFTFNHANTEKQEINRESAPDTITAFSRITIDTTLWNALSHRLQ
jgi:hypothetical protein